jgi:hypothetical protein
VVIQSLFHGSGVLQSNYAVLYHMFGAPLFLQPQFVHRREQMRLSYNRVSSATFNEVLPSGFAMLYYIYDAKLFCRCQRVPHKEHITGTSNCHSHLSVPQSLAHNKNITQKRTSYIYNVKCTIRNTHTHTHTPRRTPLKERSARRRNRSLHDTQQTQ